MYKQNHLQQRSRVNTASLGKAAAVVGAAGLTAPLLWIAYSRFFVNHNLPLPPAVNTERHSFSVPDAGQLSYYADRSGSGRPLVLLHSINAGASTYEMQPLFEYYQGKRPVYALDLPGFGFSERADRVYTPELYARAILGLLQQELQGETGADVVALSLSSEFAARVALSHPHLFHSLTLIAPSGFSAPGQNNRTQRISERGTSARVHRLLSAPLWGRALFDLLATRPSIAYFLGRSFAGPIDQGLLEYDYLTTHQPGAHFAPLYFISGALFSPTIREQVYARLKLPVLVLYDTNSFVRFDALPAFCHEHPNWHAVRISPTRGLPHFEKLDATVQELAWFWERADDQPLTRQAGEALNASY